MSGKPRPFFAPSGHAGLVIHGTEEEPPPATHCVISLCVTTTTQSTRTLRSSSRKHLARIHLQKRQPQCLALLRWTCTFNKPRKAMKYRIWSNKLREWITQTALVSGEGTCVSLSVETDETEERVTWRVHNLSHLEPVVDSRRAAR